MSSERKKTVRKSKVKLTATIPLPKIKRAGKYFQDFWKKLKPNGTTLSVQNSCLFITTESEEVLADTRAAIDTEMKKFIESNRSVINTLPPKEISPITKGQRKRKKLIPHGIIPRARIRDCQHSKHVNRVLRNTRQHWNRIKIMWKQWYIKRRKFNAKFKAISKYFGTLIRQRHRTVSFYKQEKRSRSEYYQQKILGRKRDRLKEKRAYQVKQRNERIKTKSASKYNLTPNAGIRTASGVSKLKFITADAAKTMMLHLKNKKESHLRMIGGGKLGRMYDFPLFPWLDTILIDKNKFVMRYYNQQILIYTASIGTNRPLKRNLIHVFSTLDGNEVKSNWNTEHTRFFSIKEPSPVTQKNINSSRKTKPDVARKALLPMSANDHISVPVKVKSKKLPQHRHVKTSKKH